MGGAVSVVTFMLSLASPVHVWAFQPHNSRSPIAPPQPQQQQQQQHQRLIRQHRQRRQRWRREKCCCGAPSGDGINDGEGDDDSLEAQRLRSMLSSNDEVADFLDGLPAIEPMSEELQLDVEENAPTSFEITRDVMGINLITYILGFLVIVSTLANLTLGNGWLNPASSSFSSSPPPSSAAASFKLPPGYTPPTTSELIQSIPESDLKRLIEANGSDGVDAGLK